MQSEDDRELWLGCLMHIGDLANPAKKWQTHVKWSHAVIWEFYSQVCLKNRVPVPTAACLSAQTSQVLHGK
jgi:hypothetical protein